MRAVAVVVVAVLLRQNTVFLHGLQASGEVAAVFVQNFCAAFHGLGFSFDAAQFVAGVHRAVEFAIVVFRTDAFSEVGWVERNEA